ncbi:MAG: NAD-dependent epimerase/dehydratase family protein [bacterium]
MTKILITGATGYLGGAILQEAHRQGYDLRALCRREPEPGTFPDRMEVCLGDINDLSSLTGAVSGCEAVIHTAGLVSIWRRDPADFYRVNVEGTENILRAAGEKQIRVVYTSSFFALGPTGASPANETWLNTEILPPTHYARSKALALQRVKSWIAAGHGIVPVYPALIYGPGKATQGNHITQMIADFVHRRVPGILGTGDKRWTFSYVQDVARGHLLALEKGEAGEGYILGGEDASLVEFLELLEAVTGVKRPRRRIPFAAAQALAWMEEIRARWSRHYIPRLTREMVDVYQYHWRYSSQKAITQLGYTRTPLKVGILKTLESLGLAPPGRKKHDIVV